MKIVEIAFTGYPVTDMERARAFYEGVLKLESTRTVENPDGHWIEYDLGLSTFAISNMSRRNGNLRVMVRPLPSRSKISILRWPSFAPSNVKFVLEPFETPVCRMAIVADPDGNSICIHKRHAR